MKKDIKLIAEEVEQKIEKNLNVASDVDKLTSLFNKHHIHFNSPAVKKLLLHLKESEKPSHETLDRLALFLGYQNWQSFREALQGMSGAESNYGDEKKKSNK
jgi:hypothetical protein